MKFEYQDMMGIKYGANSTLISINIFHYSSVKEKDRLVLKLNVSRDMSDEYVDSDLFLETSEAYFSPIVNNSYMVYGVVANSKFFLANSIETIYKSRSAGSFGSFGRFTQAEQDWIFAKLEQYKKIAAFE